MAAKTIERRHQLGQVPLREYFASIDELASTLAAVQYKFVNVLLKATHPKTGRGTGKDNYVCGVGTDIEDLASYVSKRIDLKSVYGHEQLPKLFAPGLNHRQWDLVLGHVHFMLLCAVAVALRDSYDLYQLNGDWCFTNNIRVQHDRLARIAREFSNTYQKDNRSWHGRPANQGRRRASELGFAPGTSIGGTL